MTAEVVQLIDTLTSRKTSEEQRRAAIEILLYCVLADGAVDSHESPILNHIMAEVIPDEPEQNEYYARKERDILELRTSPEETGNLLRDALSRLQSDELRQQLLSVCKQMQSGSEGDGRISFVF